MGSPSSESDESNIHSMYIPEYSTATDFENLFGHPPTLRTYCPGRLILMGEHIDYHNYSVISMTTYHGTEVLAARNGRSEIRIASKDPDKKEATILLPSSWAGTNALEWHDYVLCGWRAIMDHVGDIQIGFDMLIHEEIPKSCGAGSTTSLVVASALTTWAISTNKEFHGLTREKFVELCFISRRYLGAKGTGVDEAAVILPHRENGLYVSPFGSRQISFDPDCAMYITRPENFCESDIPDLHCERLAEGRLASKVLLEKLGLEAKSYLLRDVQEAAHLDLKDMMKQLELLPESASREELEQLLGEDEVRACLCEDNGHMTSFKLRARARYVLSEALRVEQFLDVSQDPNRIGELMGASSNSLATDYDCGNSAVLDLVRRTFHTKYGGRITAWGKRVLAVEDCAHPFDPEGDCLLFTYPAPCGAAVRFINHS